MRRVQDDQLAADSPWLLMKPSVVTSGVILSKTTTDILNERMEMINICRLTLIRKRQHLREEFVPRPGLSVRSAETVKCIFGFNLEKDGCLEKASFNCEDCGAFCCDLHRLHRTHQDADSTSILRQQITAASSTPACPILSSSDGSQTIRKPPGRNTRIDLNQRFLAITGRQTLDSKHKALKVKEFQLIVEDLERTRGQEATSSVPLVVPLASSIPPVSSSSLLPQNPLDPIMSTFIWSMIQSNPILRDQLLSTMQSNLPNPHTSIQEEVDSDDDNTFE